MSLWWVANAVLALVALPIVLADAIPVIRSLSAVTVAATLGRVAARVGRL
ncbi:MAG TPA: hypothetical protein VJ653_02140 [Acidimicrobiales bacterium]|nr:hypothetical protein [Acidimicrobiales bacterium]